MPSLISPGEFSHSGAFAMGQSVLSCAVLANRHLELSEGLRGLLETTFSTVYVVADAESLVDGADRLRPELIALDLSLAKGDISELLARIHQSSPNSRVIVLSTHDNPTAARLALAAGADGVVLKRTLGSDFLPAVDAVMHGSAYLSPAFELQRVDSQSSIASAKAPQ